MNMKSLMKEARLWIVVVLCAIVSSVRAQITIGGSPSYLQLEADDGRIGMILEPFTPIEEEVVTLKGGDMFRLTAGMLSTYYAFDGKLAVGLVRNNGYLVEILTERVMKLSTGGKEMQVDFVCKIGAGTEVRKGDEIRLLTTVNGFEYNLVKSSVGKVAVDRIPAVDYALPLHRINLPENLTGATVRLGSTTLWPDKVVNGKNYYFYVDVDDPEAIVAVKANGSIMTPNTEGLYGISGVSKAYDITISLYKPGEVFPYKEVDCSGGQRVAELLTEAEKDCLKGLKVKGDLTAEDFELFRNGMASLEILDLLDTRFENNYIPESAFEYNATIKEIKLPEGIVGSGNNAFYFMKNLAFIVLPKTLCSFGYNEFFGCESLKKVWVKWNPIEAGMDQPRGFPIPPCAFRATSYMTDGTLIVPKGCVTAYKSAENWGNFKIIREEAPVDKVLMEKPFEKYLPSGIASRRAETVEVVPGRGGFRISAGGSDRLAVAVCDLAGRRVRELTVSGAQTFVPLAAGCYVVQAGGTGHKVMVAR